MKTTKALFGILAITCGLLASLLCGCGQKEFEFSINTSEYPEKGIAIYRGSNGSGNDGIRWMRDYYWSVKFLSQKRILKEGTRTPEYEYVDRIFVQFRKTDNDMKMLADFQELYGQAHLPDSYHYNTEEKTALEAKLEKLQGNPPGPADEEYRKLIKEILTKQYGTEQVKRYELFR